ncbi:MAG: riboflavin synthase [Verrucomicrobiota bacterium]
MFTGIIEKLGVVVSLERNEMGGRLVVDVGREMAGKLEMGESLAINGCCLTSVPLDRDGARSLARESDDGGANESGLVAFDLLEETLRVTNLGDLVGGSVVNLERSLRVGDRMSGHFVQGHVDAVGEVLAIEEKGEDHRVEVAVPASFSRNVIYKGSIAIDGISLTVAEVKEGAMSVWIIPHTWEVTNLGGRGVGERVNLEFDVLGKYALGSAGAGAAT